MRPYQPGGWRQRLMTTLALIVGVAVAARVTYDLLAPLLPLVLALLILLAAYLATTQQWRR